MSTEAKHTEGLNRPINTRLANQQRHALVDAGVRLAIEHPERPWFFAYEIAERAKVGGSLLVVSHFLKKSPYFTKAKYEKGRGGAMFITFKPHLPCSNTNSKETPKMTTQHTEGLLTENQEVPCEAIVQPGYRAVELSNAQGYVAAYVVDPEWDGRGPNSARLVACWNAFDGLTTEQVEALGAGGVKDAFRELEALADLLDDVRALIMNEGWHDMEEVDTRISKARAILARIEGKP